MINPRFAYAPISRETIDGTRKYATPDGEKLPSVTTILSATAPAEKMQALMEWKKRTGAAKAQAITTEAAGRGTRLHKWLEDYVTTGVLGTPGSNPYSIQSNAMAKVIIEQGLVNCTEYWGTEVPVYFPKIYAGTTDLAGVHEGEEAIMDHKQTNKPKKREWIDDYFIQLAAYGAAHDELHGTKIRKGVIFMCDPTCAYQQFVIEGAEFQQYSDMWWRRVEQYYLMI
jgi:genome maintenance exonuclease 1